MLTVADPASAAARVGKKRLAAPAGRTAGVGPDCVVASGFPCVSSGIGGTSRTCMDEKDQKQSAIAEMIGGVRDSQVASNDLDTWRENLEAFIAAQSGVSGPVVCSDLQRPQTGASSGNLGFSATADFGEGRQTRKFFLRYRYPVGIMGPYLCDIPGQFATQKALNDAGLPVPKPLWLDPSGSFLEHPGFVVEFVSGRVAPQSYFQDGVIAEAPPERRREMILNVVRTLVEVHALDWQRCGLNFLKHRGEGHSWLERDFSWYMTAATLMRPDVLETMRKVEAWLLAHQPRQSGCVLNHGDANLANYMFEASGARVVAVLDWEMAHLNPPEVDLAYLGVANEVVAQGAHVEGLPSHTELIEEYAGLSGYRPANLDYFRTFALARLTIIFHVAVRHMSPEQCEATRAGWGWFEDHLLERLHGEI